MRDERLVSSQTLLAEDRWAQTPTLPATKGSKFMKPEPRNASPTHQ